MPPSELHDVPVARGTSVRVLLSVPAGEPKGVVLLLHGIAGAATSKVVTRAAIEAWSRGWVAARVNLRNCLGTAPLSETLYNAGLSADLAAVLGSPPVSLFPGRRAAIGFSLGGSILLKYLGEAARETGRSTGAAWLDASANESFALDGPGQAGRFLPHFGTGSGIEAAVAVSPAVDLLRSVEQLERWRGAPYHVTFVRKLVEIARERRALGLGGPPASMLRTRSLRSFDRRHTAPDAGYSSPEEYYRLASPAGLLARIDTPTLLLSSADDPIVPRETIEPLRDRNPVLRGLITPRGGHCGWVGDKRPGAERLLAASAMEFIERRSASPSRRAGTEG
jgi:predicted alpha/beta-fold hydrolase